MVGLPKRLGLNGENLLWYNELEERKRGGGLEKRGLDGGGCLTQEGGGETRGMQMLAGMEVSGKIQRLNKGSLV